VIADRLTEVRARIAAAARSVGRDPLTVRLIAVSKTIALDRILEAMPPDSATLARTAFKRPYRKSSHRPIF
jgi:uncharacterized pyridoxal phosphate-containing UPF0001 family protein